MIGKREVPEVVSLVALGSSKLAFMNETMMTGNQRGLADEVWVVNKLGVSVKHDLLFRMDDMRDIRACNEKRYKGGNVEEPKSIHETYNEFFRNHDRPIVTSTAYPEYPMSLEYPLEGVINTIGYSYFRTTPAYAAAFAIHIGVKQLRIFGCDFVYPNNKFLAESGRANMEFILGIGMAMGMEVWLPPTTTLMDSCIPTVEKMYGYVNPFDVLPDPENDSKWKVYPRPYIGEKDRQEVRLKERAELQTLLNKYRDEVKHDLINGEWITVEDINNHNEKKLLDASRDEILFRDFKGAIRQEESQKGDVKCQVQQDIQKE